MVAVLALVGAPSAAANPPNPLCLDEGELGGAVRAQSDATYRLAYDPARKGTLGALFAPQQRMLREMEEKARAGDVASASRLGTLWSECMLSGIEYAQDKREQAVGFLEFAHAAGNRDAAYHLGMLTAVGLRDGMPSLLRAAPLLIESGRQRAVSNEVLAAADTYAAVLVSRLSHLTAEAFQAAWGATPKRRRTDVLVHYDFCAAQASVEVPPEGMDQAMLEQVLTGPMAGLPTDGLACDARDTPIGLRVPLEIPAA
ncbi:hypothetical protein ACF3M1_08605 [Luteimonas sp. WGS1318]|uniref:hypothetical protein n=1 Tax=Luteimonas sp. WGS1318 TaxID=3366815 RepID=UPI00372D3838